MGKDGGLMADRVLRDKCEHARYEAHEVNLSPTGAVLAKLELCPGGPEVTDAEITEMAYSIWQAEQMDEYHREVL